jgi:hypothetical protein
MNLEFHFTSISGVGGSILSKEVKIVLPFCTLEGKKVIFESDTKNEKAF